MSAAGRWFRLLWDVPFSSVHSNDQSETVRNQMTKPMPFQFCSTKTPLGLLVGMFLLGVASPSAAADKTLIDFFLPTPIHDRLQSDVWALRPSARATSRTAWKMPP